jgi:hypothetical protein
MILILCCIDCVHELRPVTMMLILCCLVPPVMEVGCCLVGGFDVTQFAIANEGGPGRFCIIPREMWPATNFKVSWPELIEYL